MSDLRAQIDAVMWDAEFDAMHDSSRNHRDCGPCATRLDMLMAVVQPALDQQSEAFRALSRNVGAQARDIGHLEAERDQLKAIIRRINQMADTWEEDFPDKINTSAVVSAIRIETERAALNQPQSR